MVLILMYHHLFLFGQINPMPVDKYSSKISVPHCLILDCLIEELGLLLQIFLDKLDLIRLVMSMTIAYFPFEIKLFVYLSRFNHLGAREGKIDDGFFLPQLVVASFEP